MISLIKDSYSSVMHILLVMIYQMSGIHPCNIEVCLTWSAEHDMIAFRCKVNYLTWKVEFYNQYHREQAYCLSPIPHSECFHLYKNCSITQDANTNITTLTVRGHIDDTINGKWTCYHGTNLGTASVNVTVLKEGGNRKIEDNCWQKFTSWTFVGIVSSVAVMHVFYFVRKKMNLCTDTRLEKCLNKNERHRSRVLIVIGLFVMAIVAILPFLIGVRTNKCIVYSIKQTSDIQPNDYENMSKKNVAQQTPEQKLQIKCMNPPTVFLDLNESLQRILNWKINELIGMTDLLKKIWTSDLQYIAVLLLVYLYVFTFKKLQYPNQQQN